MLWRASLRYLWHRPWQMGTALLGIVLGVAVVVAVDLANSSASRGFELSQQALTGRTTHQIVGGPRGLPEQLYVALRTELGLRTSAPVVEGSVTTTVATTGGATASGGRLRVLGVDPFAEAAVRPSSGGRATALIGSRLLRPDAIALLAEDAARLGIEQGDTLAVLAAGRERDLTIAALIDESEAAVREGLRNILVTDIATAQVLLGKVGVLDRIDLVLATDELPAWRARLAALLPPDAQLVEAEQQTVALQRMSGAFQLNLTAFSLLALVVGAFLIYNSMAFSVVQRRRLIGMLRALGVARGQIFGLILAEAAVLAFIGTAVGLVIGIGLAELLLELVTRTINDLYYALAVRDVTVAPGSLLKGAALGLGVSMLAAVVPAHEAASVAPRAALSRSDLERQRFRIVPALGLAGGVLVVAGVLPLITETSLFAGFAGLFLLLMGAALLAPLATFALVAGMAPLVRSTLARMAVRSASAHLSRSSVAIAALMIAVSAVIGVGVMVGSFRYTFADWLDATLQADFTVSAEAGEASPALRATLAGIPGVAAVSASRFARVGMGDEQVRLRAVDAPLDGATAFRVQAGDLATLWPAFRAGEAVLVTEPFAMRFGLTVGDRLTLATALGERGFRIGAVVYDYTSSSGSIVMARDVYRRFWNDPAIDRFAIYASQGTDLAVLARNLSKLDDGDRRLQVRSQQQLRAYALRIFDQTFTVTRVLQLLAMLVAGVGVLSALLALALERAREFGVLRALGFTPGQLAWLVIMQTGLLGLIAGLLAIPLGLTLAAALTLVINRRAFGWTLQFSVDPWMLLQALLLAVAAALAAGLYPAWRMRGQVAAMALREE